MDVMSGRAFVKGPRFKRLRHRRVREQAHCPDGLGTREQKSEPTDLQIFVSFLKFLAFIAGCLLPYETGELLSTQRTVLPAGFLVFVVAFGAYPPYIILTCVGMKQDWLHRLGYALLTSLIVVGLWWLLHELEILRPAPKIWSFP
jgi:hypothetical protein